jgi:uncharacterized membrane protein YfcA
VPLPLLNLALGGVCILGVGISLGLLGAGGAAIAVPVLVYVVGLEPHAAVTASILLVGGVSAFGTLLNHRRHTVRWGAVLSFAPSGIAGAWIGSKLSYLLSGRALLLLFSTLLLVSAVRILRTAGEPEDPRQRGWAVIVAAGFAIGVLTGVLGVGGGFVIVPALLFFAGLNMHEAVGTSLAIITCNSAAALAGHLEHSRPPLEVLAVMLAAAALGMAAGTAFSHRTDPKQLKRWFAYLLFALAGWMIVRNIPGCAPTRVGAADASVRATNWITG